MSKSALVKLLVALLLGSAALLAQAQRAVPVESPSTLPLLPRGLVLGTTLYGSASLAALNDKTLERFENAAANGLSGFTLYLDWPDLEAAPGQLDVEALVSQLDPLAERGLAVFVNITIGNIGHYSVPADLSNGVGGLAVGVNLNDSDVVARFLALLDQVVPLLAERGSFLLGLGNEIDERLDDAPESELAAYAELVAAAREHMQTLRPDLPVAVTLTSSAVREQTMTWQVMREVADHVAINYAPIDAEWRVLAPELIADDFDKVLDAFGNGVLVIQELTCPSAESMGASPWWQSQCLAVLLERLRAHRQTRFVSLFSLEDLDGATCQAVQAVFEPLLTDAPADFSERFREYLCTLGILDSDGKPKPGWGIALDWVAKFRASQTRLQMLGRHDEGSNRRLLLRPPPSGRQERFLPLTATTGEQRRYQVHVPADLPPPGGWPVVLIFHGGGGRGDSFREESRWDEVAESQNFVAVFAEGTRPDPESPPAFSANPQTWNDGTGRSAIGAVDRGEDDLAYVHAVLEDLAGWMPIASDRIYATGFSNGAGMTLHLARNMPERLSAVAAVAGKDIQMPLPDVDELPSILYMTGTEDPLNPIDGGDVFLFWNFLGNFPPIETLFERWRTGLDCPIMPTSIEASLADTEARRYFPCHANTTAEFWLLEGHGHHWPGGRNLLAPSFWIGPDASELDATRTIWSFFVQSRRVGVR
ncbi:MAG: hypothetical protein JJU31_01660 [Wenzhouxiangella sp.]|nr:hypothetical protein [Wenzhouxiangella sp.]